ncbi:F-box/WD repeat-containing protein 9-like isoform X2 [Dreissena polymorpha]|uniref:F-box/WD repeat-containing protein 9-like isoform X2 n=1 Tax=Dreissena polymorpha TaxID=45954 RepID=UPI002263C1E3|nr:F-box/WD repeat-containing protein 9-like isoform X2 [Dreissena polymorpha]
MDVGRKEMEIEDKVVIDKLDQMNLYMDDHETREANVIHSEDCNTNKSYDTIVIDSERLYLSDMPVEILIHIASFLESRDIISSLYQTCRLFCDLFSNYSYWKTRISQRWKKQYPIFEAEDFNWRKACMEREEVYKLWSDHKNNYHHFKVQDGFFAAVDVVHLFKEGRFLATGSRDRHLNILDLNKHEACMKPHGNHLTAFQDTKTHKGWVWSMASHGDTLATGSWDTFIRLWDTADGNVAMLSEFKLKTAILGLYFEQNFIAAGGFDKRLHMFDPRAPEAFTRKHYHSQPLLCVTGDEDFVITGGEDKTIAIFDRAAGKKYKQIQIPGMVMSMSYGRGHLWVGDGAGKLHVLNSQNKLFDETNMQAPDISRSRSLDPFNRDILELQCIDSQQTGGLQHRWLLTTCRPSMSLFAASRIKVKVTTFDVGHKGRLTGLVHTDGGVFTGCSDSSVKVLEPSTDPSVIASLSAHSGEVTRISYNSGVLASASADISVGVWLPRKHVS